MIFCNINKCYPKDQAKILIYMYEISQVQSTKFLGVILDTCLNWSNHINHVCKRSIKVLGIGLIHSSAHLTLYYSFLFPYINYCNIVWAATYPTYLKSLHLIQKRFLRLISHSSRYTPSLPLFSKYQLLTIDKLNVYHTCLFIHKFVTKIFLLLSKIYSFPLLIYTPIRQCLAIIVSSLISLLETQSSGVN